MEDQRKHMPGPTARRLGVMQGRLSPRPSHRLQAFPLSSWQREFSIARDLGLDGIEWIFEADSASQNPLTSKEGRERIRRVIDESGTRVLSICGDYFMVHRLSEEGATGEDAAKMLVSVIAQASSIGATRILLPWLEEAALDTQEKQDTAIKNLQLALPAAEQHEVALGLEMEIPGDEYCSIIERIHHPQVTAYYDTGNSTAQGLDVGRDIVSLKGHLGAIHIKDRLTGGGSQLLGQGDTNFPALFEHLREWNFEGDLVLQHYFEDSEEDAKNAISLIRNYWPRQEAA